ncbi:MULTISPECIES: recombinase family protein [Micrococcus]|uniref:recombinase family protein n=1 Tax=Micrococcus luteus TaxID=1270 RepID=UPI0019CFDA49|nr:recombinase family protein [Micrococcus luteus]MBN6767399.1 recombinase family protein [Micrococcus luteus]MBN6827214.1 recombinase family protein [Micrococcus luteus]MBN6846307.1 recombinase family protein [Micrococcus luteus]MBN6862370.1 recombinase family protein [Micrococcus luteus]MBN6863727.1 recombinase family protein [Micrococcus luteus]
MSGFSTTPLSQQEAFACQLFTQQRPWTSHLEGQGAALQAVGCSKVFSDRLSGAKSARPGLTDALAYLRDGEDTLVVTRLDRLGRSLPDALRTVQDLANRDIGLQALDVELNTSTATGRLMLNMLLMLADWERDLLRERTREGVARARAAGRRPGPKPKLDQEKTAAVRAAVAGGQSVAAVARSFGVSRPTIYKALEGAL